MGKGFEAELQLILSILSTMLCPPQNFVGTTLNEKLLVGPNTTSKKGPRTWETTQKDHVVSASNTEPNNLNPVDIDNEATYEEHQFVHETVMEKNVRGSRHFAPLRCSIRLTRVKVAIHSSACFF